MSIRLGIIADDVTGATDVASWVALRGARVVQFFGIPAPGATVPDCDVVVVALKIRSIEPADAVRQAREAARWLLQHGARQLYYKYCSTFDSTPRGNIGPVADALADDTGTATVVFAPSSPGNGRAVFQGHLFVNDVLLENSPLKDHPINPMRHSDLRELLAEQGGRSNGLVPLPTVLQGEQAVRDLLATLTRHDVQHAVLDAVTDADLDVLGAALSDVPLVTGAAGLAAGMAGTWGLSEQVDLRAAPATGGAVVSGSCSARTREQVAHHAERQPSLFLDPSRIASPQDVAGTVQPFLAQVRDDQVPLLYTTAEPEQVATFQRQVGVERAAAHTEAINGEAARLLVEAGRRRLVLAGGETAGAAVAALGVRSVLIGPPVAPGVPWVVTTDGEPLALVLKSGNFGKPDMFTTAFEVTW